MCAFVRVCAEQLTFSNADGTQPLDGAEVAVLARLNSADMGEALRACAALLAVRHANARDGSIVSDLGAISSHFRMRSLQ